MASHPPENTYSDAEHDALETGFGEDSQFLVKDANSRPCIVIPPWEGHLDEVKDELSESLATLLAGYPQLNKDKEAIHEVLDSYSIERFTSSYNEFTKSLLPISQSLYVEAMDLCYARYLFSLRPADKKVDLPLLELFGLEGLSYIQYLHFEMFQLQVRGAKRWTFHEERAVEAFEAWKDAMEQTNALLSYEKLHLVFSCCVGHEDSAGAVLDVLENLPQMKNCSVFLAEVSSPSLHRRLRRVIKKLTINEKKLQNAEGSLSFLKYLSLPKELRLHILSFTELVSVQGHYDSRPTWIIEGSTWRDGGFSTTCECGEGFYSLLMVSRQFRKESLLVLFSNNFSFTSPHHEFGGLQTLSLFLNYPLWLPNISHMKHVTLQMHIKDHEDWMEDDEKFKSTTTDLLRILVEHSGPLMVISVEVCRLRYGWEEPWHPDDWQKLQTFESDLCEVVERLYLANPSRCRIYIDWGDLDINYGVGGRPWTMEDVKSEKFYREIEEDHSNHQPKWEKTKWLLNSPRDAFKDS